MNPKLDFFVAPRTCLFIEALHLEGLSSAGRFAIMGGISEKGLSLPYGIHQD
jgi:hypothetical protein